MEDRTLVQKCRARKEALWAKRAPMDPMARDLASFISPLSGRFSVSQKDRSKDLFDQIVDSTGTGALEVLRSGVSAGLANANNPWLRLTSGDQQLDKHHAVKIWLSEAVEGALGIFARSNTYEAIPHYFGEQGLFGTSGGLLLEDEANVIHHFPLTWGQYAIATDEKGQVDTFAREFSLSTSQMVKRWGREGVPLSVRNQYDRRNFDQEHTICHLIEPREEGERVAGKIDGKNMPWRSVYFVDGSKNRKGDDVLEEGGFRWFPALVSRWEVIGANTWGGAPAMNARNPIKRLQKMTRVEGVAAAYQAEPVLQMPPKMKGQKIFPGARLEVPPGQEVRPVWQPSNRIADLDVLLRRIQSEVDARMFRPLFSIMSDSDGRMTATQVREIAGERLSQLGPTIGRMERELLSPMVSITLNIMADRGLLPPVPPELEGRPISAKLIGVLAQAQKAAAAGPSDQLQAKAHSFAEFDPKARHMLNTEQIIRNYADVIGADPSELESPERFQELVEKEAQAQAAQAQSAVVAEQAGAANQMAQAQATAGA